ncbi:hypothetical protein AUJ84_02625 [Candidatus Pacearchaeota archaeon CG1_02_32_132]|nr:MAG: hypothetical protein AUJ84_02625 [Candidatus Pacearchaeota archaeon CG1_02_32_132]
MIRFNRKLDSIDKIHLFISVIIILSLVFAIIVSILNANWYVLFISISAFFLALSPTLFEWKYKIDIPEELEIAIAIFVYASLFLGEVQGYYTKFWWWDAVLHTASGIALGFIGFIILFVLYKGNKIAAKPFLLVMFSFCFSVALGTLWEIFEFSMDIWLGTNLQKSGLVDTMSDLIVNSISALFASVVGYIYLKGRKTHIMEYAIERFVRNNPELFNPSARNPWLSSQ